MKKLYQFVVNKEIEKDVQVVEKDKDGKDITVIRKQKVEEPYTYFIRKPSRSDYDEAELFYSVQFSSDVRAGILTRSEIIKRFANEDTTIKRVYEDYTIKENELQRIIVAEKTPENLERKIKLENELLSILVDIQNFELNKSSVFEHTAENRARNKTIFWWIMALAHKVEDNKEVPIFMGSDFKEKQEYYDKLIEKEEDKHLQEVIQRFFYLVPAWYIGQLNSEEDFKRAEDLRNDEVKRQQEEVKKEIEQEKKP